VIKNATYNQNIALGQTITIGFQGTVKSSFLAPRNFKLSNYIIGSPKNDYIIVSTDDEMIGKAYFQKLKIEDICIEDDGIKYAKNQLNLVGTLDSQYDQFVELGEMYGYDIVGYIDFTKDYQIKFKEDKTYEQMNEFVSILQQYNFIEEVNLNLVMSMDEDYYPTKDTEWPASATNNVWSSTPGGSNWGVEAINAPKAWDYVSDMYSVKIGLIDNMFDTSHEDLSYTKVWNNPSSSYISKKGSDHGTHVAGTVGLLYSINPALTGIQVKNIILSTANTVGLTESTGTYNYDTVNAGEAVKKALVTKGQNHGSLDPTGIILGVVEIDALFSSDPIDDVMVSAYQYSTTDVLTKHYSNVANTNANGEFDLELSPGTYHIEFYKSGYLPLVVYDVEVKENEVIYMEKVLVKENFLNSILDNKAYGAVRDALTGNPLSDVTIKFRQGWNKKYGDYIGETVVTNSSGKYEVTLDRGYYTAEMSKDGYITGYINIVTTLPGQNKNQDAVLSSILSGNEYRIVLTWGSIPSDLDSHLYGVTENYNFHVYYSNKTFYYGGKVIAGLDVDDTTSYGPETVTLTVEVDGKGNYRYSVHDFTNRSRTNSSELSISTATVRVYRGNNLIATYHVPTNQVGTWWDVFEINNNNIKSINKIR